MPWVFVMGVTHFLVLVDKRLLVNVIIIVVLVLVWDSFRLSGYSLAYLLA